MRYLKHFLCFNPNRLTALNLVTLIKMGLFTLLARDVTCISRNYHNVIPGNLILLSRNRLSTDHPQQKFLLSI